MEVWIDRHRNSPFSSCFVPCTSLVIYQMTGPHSSTSFVDEDECSNADRLVVVLADACQQDGVW
jgi:hypothetical protein